MRMILLLVGLLIWTDDARAGPMVSPGDILAVLTHDWNDDGGQDRAVLVAGTEGADLYLYLSTDEPDGRALSAHVPDLVWRGLMWGTQPELELNAAGSLKVHAMNEAIGRNRWQETLTIALRNGVWMVLGYTFVARDTLDPDYAYSCDVNLSNGKGIFNGEAYRSKVRSGTVEGWGLDRRPSLDVLCPRLP